MLRQCPRSYAGRVDVAGVEVGHLPLHDVVDLGTVTLPTFSLFGTPEPLAIAGGLLQQARRRAGSS